MTVLTLVFNAHFHLSNRFNYSNGSKVIDAGSYPDIQELMVTSFAGIADYSSWIYDILLLRRPGFIYVADVDSYLSQRELYFPIDSTPFPFSSNVEELCVSITNFYENKFNVLVNLFIENEGAIDAWECIGSSCRRHSSE